jgi:AcrR family transcriptional regulator
MSRARAPRTQEQRRTETLRKLTGAAIECLLDLGYAKTTVKEICARAELSHGALFRFFPTVLDLILAAAESVGLRQIAEFDERFSAIAAGPRTIGTALQLLRDTCRSPVNTVFYELLVAARTDAELRRGLKPGIKRYFATIAERARSVPGLEGIAPDLVETLLFMAIHFFDGEAIVRGVYPQPALEDRRLRALQTVIDLLLMSTTR